MGMVACIPLSWLRCEGQEIVEIAEVAIANIAAPTGKRPNFLIIVADDLGFSDVGCFGSEIRTPNIDKLASQGVRCTGFHAAAACSAMIMTGTDHHIAGLGNLIEFTNYTGWLRFDGEPLTESGKPYDTKPQRGMPGYEGYLNEHVVTLAECLRDGGYRTMMAGKCHLGLKPERSPHSRGFDRSFAMLPGSANHYNYRPEGEIKNGTPQILDTSLICLHSEDGEYIPLDELPKDFYSSNTYGDKLIEYLSEWKEGNKKEGQEDRDQPFFAYLPFSAPHWPLQAPKEYIDHYRGVYDKGPEVLRQKRLAKLVELGLIDKDTEPHPVVDDGRSEAWEEFSDFERKMSSRAMEAFAGMVEAIDVNVGRVLDHLKCIGELDSTFIMFLSDNGAEGAAYEAYPLVRDSMMGHIRKYYNNSLENIGAADSFVWYGPRWAQASTAPSRLYKMFTTEGGIRVPCILKGPGCTSSTDGAIRHEFATVMDIAPTLLDMAGVKHPAPTYQGRQVAPMRGKSMSSWLRGDAPSTHPPDFVYGWEFCGRAAIRRAQWKAVFIPAPKGPHKWQLYDLSKDAGEIHDLAESYPKILEELLVHWDKYVEEVGIIPLHPELGAYLEATEDQMEENAWIEYEYWRPGGLEEPGKFFRNPQRFPDGIAQASVVGVVA
ncbi:arylsulfatase [Penicillium cinerascens]|uniref:Arylsulfatase n=1 Tax=Penicillium cinerascens TaxID=70096 RepID=A0A9W9T7J7_9EURO|nr:arylsulfatase [Penicillium cinerascens]KAJ5212493.1 arylsulfatase [Penicillium cinerascens]